MNPDGTTDRLPKLRVNEVTTNRGPVLGVMGSADSRWRYDPYCQVIEPE